MVKVIKIDDSPVQIFGTYRKLDSDEDNGDISSAIRTIDLDLTLEAGQQLLKDLRVWINWIISVQKITLKDRPDHPYELTVTISAPGMNYNIEMESLDQTIIWDSAEGMFTLLPRQAFELSIEAFIYYLNTLDDLVNAVTNL